MDCELKSSPYTLLVLGKLVQFELELSDFFLFSSTNYIKRFVLIKTVCFVRIARVIILVKIEYNSKQNSSLNLESRDIVSQREGGHRVGEPKRWKR